MMEELRPCPYCWSEADLSRNGNGTWGWFDIYCTNQDCMASMSSFTTFREGDKNAEKVEKENIIKAWNRSADDGRIETMSLRR
jgi:hypothetical protein